MKIRGVIDVGANYVHLQKEFDEWRKRGATKFLLFEPVTESYNKMLDFIFSYVPAQYYVDTYNIALGDMTGKVMMNIEKNNNGQSSSILPPKVHLKQYPWIKFTDTEEVIIDLLDNIDYDRMLYDFLHIDVQGYELEVLKGATGSLEYINEIECEVNTEELYEGCPMLIDIDFFLHQHGFERTDLKMLCHNWGDATYRRF
jgi:FkbM family methyltransferase